MVQYALTGHQSGVAIPIFLFRFILIVSDRNYLVFNLDFSDSYLISCYITWLVNGRTFFGEI